MSQYLLNKEKKIENEWNFNLLIEEENWWYTKCCIRNVIFKMWWYPKCDNKNVVHKIVIHSIHDSSQLYRTRANPIGSTNLQFKTTLKIGTVDKGNLKITRI